MRRDAVAEGRRWLVQADRDLDDARFVFSGQRYNLVCFPCQQSAEKALKGYLHCQGAQMVWGHSAVELLQEASESDPALGELAEYAAVLDRFYIPTRTLAGCREEFHRTYSLKKMQSER